MINLVSCSTMRGHIMVSKLLGRVSLCLLVGNSGFSRLILLVLIISTTLLNSIDFSYFASKWCIENQLQRWILMGVAMVQRFLLRCGCCPIYALQSNLNDATQLTYTRGNLKGHWSYLVKFIWCLSHDNACGNKNKRKIMRRKDFELVSGEYTWIFIMEKKNKIGRDHDHDL